jgi:hypothetical protein
MSDATAARAKRRQPVVAAERTCLPSGLCGAQGGLGAVLQPAVPRRHRWRRLERARQLQRVGLVRLARCHRQALPQWLGNERRRPWSPSPLKRVETVAAYCAQGFYCSSVTFTGKAVHRGWNAAEAAGCARACFCGGVHRRRKNTQGETQINREERKGNTERDRQAGKQAEAKGAGRRQKLRKRRGGGGAMRCAAPLSAEQQVNGGEERKKGKKRERERES